MKADIPDKILISRGEDGRIHHSYWTTDQQLVPFEDTIYIRKDALLEWAKERREAVAKEVVIREGVRLGADAAFEELIDKLNEM